MPIDLQGNAVRDALDELRRYRDGGNLLLLAGAGLSMPAGAPSWIGLLERLARELPGDLQAVASRRIEERRFLEAAGLIRGELGERFFVLLERIFGRELDPQAPGLVHPLLARIPFRVRLTTNYDRLIFLRDVPLHPGNPLQEVTQEESPFLRRFVEDPDRRLLVHLHGIVTRPQTIVLTRDDYRELFRNPEYRKTLESLLSRPLLILGFGLEDLDVMASIEELARLFAAEAPRWALVARSDRAGELWERFHVTAVEYDPTPGHPEVGEFLRALVPAVVPAAEAGAEPAPEDRAAARGAGPPPAERPPAEAPAPAPPPAPLPAPARQAPAAAAPTAPAHRPFMAPLPTRPFAGREREIERFASLLTAPDGPPVVPIAGIAGVGKTTLAMQLAQRLGDRFPDGVLWHSVGRGDWTGALPAFEQELGLPPASGSLESRAATFRRAVGHRRLLMFLDDVGSLDDVRPLLPGPGPARVVVTTRNLELAREANVPSLEVPAGPQALEILAAYAGRPLIDGDLNSATRVVDHLGALPLALEVAGSAAGEVGRLAPVAEEVATLQGPLSEPVTRLLDEVWSRLDEDARTAWCALGLSAVGSASLEALARAMDRPLVVAGRAVAVLRRSGVVVESAGRPACHRTVFDYARRKLAERADRGDLVRRWGEHFVALAGGLQERWTAGDRAAARRALDADGDNLDLLVLSADDVTSSRLVYSLCALVLSDSARAERWFQHAIEIAERWNDEKNLAALCSNLSLVHQARGDLAAAERLLRRAIEIGERLRSSTHLRPLYARGAELAEAAGRPDDAGEYRAKLEALEEPR